MFRVVGRVVRWICLVGESDQRKERAELPGPGIQNVRAVADWAVTVPANAVAMNRNCRMAATCNSRLLVWLRYFTRSIILTYTKELYLQ